MNGIVSAELKTAPYSAQRQIRPCWEIAYCAAGSGVLLFDGGSLPFKKGETAAVPPMTPYAVTGDKGARTIHLRLDGSLLPIREPTVFPGEGSPHLQNAFEAALYHFRSEDPRRTVLLAAYGRLISCYLAACRKPSRTLSTVEIIEREISGRFTDPGFELDGFLRTLPFNYDYLRKLFQKETGVTPLQYLNSLRLQLAADALLSARAAGASMADIARTCGFREPLYFSRMFKKAYGVAPSYYLQSKREKTILPDGLTPPEDA